MTDRPVTSGIIDLHTHVLPGVDDGAQDMGEAVAALALLMEEGVTHVAATPHFRASLMEMPGREAARIHAFDAAYDALRSAAAEAELEIEISRGCEFKLDAPRFDLSDPRLRLAGSRYALVEFATFQLPAFAARQLDAVCEAGWIPLLAHPERYAGVSGGLDRVEAWLEAGVLLQVNARSLLGWYGPEAQATARELLRRGWVCCLSSDYHARGTPDLAPTAKLLREGRPPDAAGSAMAEPDAEAARLVVDALLAENPRRILAGAPVDPVPPWWVEDIDRKTRRGWLR